MKTSSTTFASSLGWKPIALPEPDPAPRALDLDADPGQQHDDEADEADGEQDARVPLPDAVVDTRRHEEPDGTDERPHELALEEVPRRAVVGERLHRRRRQDHHQTDEVEAPRRARRSPTTTSSCSSTVWRRIAATPAREVDRAPPRERTPSMYAISALPGVGGFGDQERDLGGEVVAARLVPAVVPVPRRARRREQHDVAGLRVRGRGAHDLAHGVRHARPDACPRRPSRRRAPPHRTRRPRECGRPRAASTPRSRSLLRPPASSTTESNAEIACRAACGFVAFESSYYLTPLASPTSATRWGRVRNDDKRVSHTGARRAGREGRARRGERVRAIVRQRARE